MANNDTKNTVTNPSTNTKGESRVHLETKEDGMLLYDMWWQEVEDLIESGEPQSAFELLLALGRYCFYGEEYNGSIGEVRRSFYNKSVLIDNQRARYHASANGGKGSHIVSDEEIIAAVQNGNYSSNAELGRAFGITGQAIGKRLKKLGLSLREPKTANYVPNDKLVSRSSEERLSYLANEPDDQG